MKTSIKSIYLAVLIIISITVPLLNAQNLNTILMNATYRIEGPKNFGSGFIIGKPSKNNPKFLNYVLVTAKHVLDDIEGDYAKIILRKKVNEVSYEKLDHYFKVRDNGKNLWSTHSDTSTDVAVMHLALPVEAYLKLLPMSYFADDSTFIKIELHPGDELFCLGFPKGLESNEFGFPILRSGHIASYPLTPSKTVKRILYDVEVFGGNSGGPVFLSQTLRKIGKAIHGERSYDFIIGVMSTEFEAKSSFEGYYEGGVEKIKLKVASVVPSQFIIETINALPEPDEMLRE